MMEDESLNVDSERDYPTPYAASPLLPLLLLSLSSQKHSPSTKTEFRQQYDYIVVGAGAAGSVVAARLSEIPCISVLLLEAGKSPPRLTEIPAIAKNFHGTDIDYQFLTEPQTYTAAGLINRSVPWPSGKTLGGSTALNGMKCVRGNRQNYDEWANLGAEGWSYKDVLPYFKKLENNTDSEYLASGYHGSEGPITVSRPVYEPEVKLTEIEAIINEGYRFTDPNGAEQTGFYDYQQNSRRGQRCSTAKAYLVPAENRTNLDILSNAMVRKVLFEDKRAVGIEFEFMGRTRQVRAEMEVILSAGTINTSKLLMLSGIGPVSELMRHNISLVADLPVGFNLQDHPTIEIYYEIDDEIPTFNEEIEDEDNINEYIFNRTGPLTASEGIQLMAFLSNPDSHEEDIPDYTLYFADFEIDTENKARYTPEVYSSVILPLVNKTLVTCTAQLLRTYSRGTVSLRSDDPYDPPVMQPNYLSDIREVDGLVQGLKTCQRILNTPTMKRLGSKPADVVYPGCEDFVEDDDLYLGCIVRLIILPGNHQCCTAKMGFPDDPSTVVDPMLRVKGVKSLRVVDPSVMPTLPYGNLNIPTIMVAEKASDIIKRSIQCMGGE